MKKQDTYVIFQERQKRLKTLQQITDMTCIQGNSQSVMCPRSGFVKSWHHGSEVYIANFPPHEYEDTIYSLFRPYGEILQIRLMMNFNGTNRGYAFILFKNAEDARESVDCLNGTLLKVVSGTWKLSVNMSRDNRRLFLTKVPKHLTREKILSDISKVVIGVKDVFTFKDWTCPSMNRGFIFIEFESHQCAIIAKSSLSKILYDLWHGCDYIIVKWAIPEPVIQEEIMDKMKKIFIRGLACTTKVEDVKNAIFSAMGIEVSDGAIRRTRDYAFVRFQTRKDTVQAIEVLNGSIINGTEVEVTLARPSCKYSAPIPPRMMVAQGRRWAQVKSSCRQADDNAQPKLHIESQVEPIPPIDAQVEPIPHPNASVQIPLCTITPQIPVQAQLEPNYGNWVYDGLFYCKVCARCSSIFFQSGINIVLQYIYDPTQEQHFMCYQLPDQNGILRCICFHEQGALFQWFRAQPHEANYFVFGGATFYIERYLGASPEWISTFNYHLSQE